jgi:hypothetical protein
MKRAVRLIVPLLFLASGAGAAVVSAGTKIAPEIAFGNHFVFGLQLFLLIFYALLLLVVPLLRAACRGELPIELTARGARFPEPANALISRELNQRVDAVERALAENKTSLDGVAAIASSSIRRLEKEMMCLQEKRSRRRTQLIRFLFRSRLR